MDPNAVRFVNDTEEKPSYEDLEKRIATLERRYADCNAKRIALTKERREFISIFDSLDTIVYISDPVTYELLYINEAGRQITNQDGNVLGKKCYSILQNLEQPCESCSNPILFSKNIGQPYIHEILNPINGRWYHCIDKVIRWIDGRMVRFEVAIDIHRRKLALDALAESQRKYSSLVENARDGVTIVQDGIRKFCNRAMVKMLGYSYEEIVEKPFIDIIAPVHREKVRTLFLQAKAKSKELPLYETAIVAKDGARKDVEVSISPIQYQGRPAIMAVLRDIGERKKMAESLFESEERYRVLNDYLNIYIPLHLGYSDETYIFRLWNKYSEKMLGYKMEEAIGKLCPVDLHETPEEAMEVVQESEAVGIYDKEINLKHKNGSLVPVHLVVVPKKNKKGKVVGLYGFAEDITLRKKAETALRESEKLFRDLVENALMGISICQDGKVVYENPEQERIFGFMENTTSINDFEQLVHPGDVKKFDVLHTILPGGPTKRMNTDLRFYPSGRIDQKADMKWVQMRASHIEYRGRDAVLINMMDITNAKRLESLLNVEDKMTSLGRVAAGMAHEIRSPLSGINLLFANLNIVLRCNDNINGEMLDEARFMVRKTMEASNKIESVVRRVLDFTRPSEMRKELININQPIEEAVRLSTVTLKKDNIGLEKQLMKKIPRCYADTRMIEQVLLNLITNAIQAMNGSDHNKRLGISSEIEGDDVVIKVADSGPGVPLTVWDKIFDPYFSTKAKGSGIGLSLSRRIIKDHQGSLEVDKSRWNGAEFIIRLPIPSESRNKDCIILKE